MLRTFDGRLRQTMPSFLAVATLALVAVMAVGTGSAAPGASDAPAGMLAFDSSGEGLGSIYLIRPDGSGLRELRTGHYDSRHPAWSPDGRQLAFYAFPDLFVVSAAGGKARRVGASDYAVSGYPRWSPDGKRIVYEHGFYIAIAAVGGGGNRIVDVGYFPVGSPDWSPNGAHFAFTVDRHDPGEIYVSNVDGSGSRRITRNKADESDSDARWSPDGRTLLFIRAAQNGSTQAVYTVSASGGVPKRLVVGTDISSVAWSPDGKQIAYLAHPKIHVYTLATRADRAFSPKPCRQLDESANERCRNLDWRSH